MRLLRQHTQLGIEITPENIRAACIKKYKNHVCLSDTITLPITHSVTDTLLQLQHRFKPSARAIFAMEYSSVIYKTITVADTLNDREISAYIRHHAPQLFGLPIDTIGFDYARISEKERAIQIVATPKNHLQDKINQVRRARFYLQAIDIDLLALVRLYDYLHETRQKTPENIAIALTGQHQLQFCVINSQQFIFHCAAKLPLHTEPLFENQLLSSLQQSYQFFQQAVPDSILSCIYLAGHTDLFNAANKLQTSMPVQISPAQLLPKRIQLAGSYQAEHLVSIALALWGLNHAV